MTDTPIKTQAARIHCQAEIDLSSSTFDAARYLAVTHANTTFLELQTTLAALSKTTSDKTAQLKALVSAHFDQYLSCHEAVRTLAADISLHHQDTKALITDTHNLHRVTDASLTVMLQRARKMRQIRHTLVVLTRMRPILELTSKMKVNLLLQDYDTLALEYTRLKHQSAKLASLALPLKRVVTAGHDIAATANTELLQKFEDMTATAADQKHTINVLTALGLVKKPILICITKQFEYLERKLAEIEAEDTSQCMALTHHLSSYCENIINECVAGLARFYNGLWSFICELLRSPTGEMAVISNNITSFEAESVQQKAWNILSRYTELLERYILPPSAKRLKLLSEVFRQIRSLCECPNAAMLNANIKQLSKTFCTKFRTTVVLDFLKQECQSAQSGLLAEYFEPIVMVLPSYSSEMSIAAPNAISHNPLMVTGSRTKVQRLVLEAQQASSAIKNASRISSESKILLHQPLVFKTFAADILQRWESIWKNIGHVLLDVLDITKQTSSCTDKLVTIAKSEDLDVDVQFRSEVFHALEEHLREMLSEFLEKVVASFLAEVTLSDQDGNYTHSTANGAQIGAQACILLVIVANCIEFREKCLRIVDGWVAQLKHGNFDEDAGKSLSKYGRAATFGTRALFNVVLSVETKCMDIYSSSHVTPLKKILQTGAAEEPLQSHNSGRHSSHTSRTGSLGMSTLSTVQSSGSNPMHTTAIPSDPRQYVFNVLLQLITLRSEIEMSIGCYPQCWDYIRTVTDPLVAALAEFLQASALSLQGPGNLEWTLCQLIVEVRFFQSALSDFLTEGTKAQMKETEKLLMQLEAGSEATKRSNDILFNQIKHQTKLYLLALQH
ncbi:Sec5 subunit of exocyst complex [Plasmopara halstedii]|uniref:Exocyst complex component n=1 Tax=Plasmopara halstedii TaxID=4781 RepID=A0A0P1B030_PLAHL|nr:Sec5 subunit of exocyst complex [Plasmopara halstedii]CEG47206.1 Sec5 subunit of exocyst complex [Plasmopara halstedii]|eukprot:XP_024583575.1 Sec5 subunit of exocyst complex [Plasmopara halstedii]